MPVRVSYVASYDRLALKSLAWIVVAVGAFACSGCRAPSVTGRPDRGHLIVLPGIGGESPAIRRLATQTSDRVPGVSAEVWDWTRIEPIGFLGDLIDLERNQRRADVLAGQLMQWCRDHPTTRLFIAAHSGGCGIVLLTCERLPADFPLERVVFISAALSPEADLTPILRRSRRGLFNYYSANDKLVLGAGTALLGTTDRVRTESAGLTGFLPPADPDLLGKLQQMAWAPWMGRLGNHGGHHDAFAPAFIEQHLLPLFALPDGGGLSPVGATINVPGGS